MATVINNPSGTTTDSATNGVGVVLAILLLLALVFALVYYGIPSARNAFSTNVNVPRSIDVNVNNPGTDVAPQQ